MRSRVSDQANRRADEEFLVKIAREVEAVMQREMFTPPGGPTYIPREYIIYLSNEDDREWQGDKRRGLEQGLFHVLSERARELAGAHNLQTKSFAVELRVDGTLNKGELAVQPIWDETEYLHSPVKAVTSQSLAPDQVDEAIRQPEQKNQRFPNNFDVRSGYFDSPNDARRFDEALRVYEETIQSSPDNLNARLAYAETLNNASRFDEALRVYEETIQRFPDNLNARLAYVETLTDARRFDDALRAYEQTIERFPNSSDNRLSLAGREQTLNQLRQAQVTEADASIKEKTANDASASPKQARLVAPATFIAKTARQSRADTTTDDQPTGGPAGEIKPPRAPASIAERAAELQNVMGQGVIDIPILLISLLDDKNDRTALAFLSSFNLNREELVVHAKRYHRKSFPRFSTFYQVAEFGDSFSFAPDAADIFQVASLIATERQANDVTSRDLFHALLRSSDPGRWLETTLGKDVIGWIRQTLDQWDLAIAITPAAVQAKMVEDRLFANPPTQRDSAAEKDLLGFEEYAEALVQIIRRPETRPPLVVGVYGPWGSGKSTFMGLVKRKLDALGQPPMTGRGRVGAFSERQLRRLRGLFRKGTHSLRVTTVDYDAWAYADAQKLWSGLVDKIAKELDAELTTRDRIAYLINSQSRRLLVALALGLVPVTLFALGYSGRRLPEWLSSLVSPDGNKPWLNLPGWITAGVWALYAYFLQKRPLTDAVASLAAKFDSAPTAGLVSRIQDEFKTALQSKIDPEKKPKSVDALRTDIRQRVERNELKIVVFIDELDRCPLEKIVEILEAIKLFLAEDIFIVLLGVDTRVAAEAIRLHYKEVRNPNLPREYLEKIVQLPLRVPTARKEDIKEYLQSFMILPEDGIQGAPTDSLAAQITEAAEAQAPQGSSPGFVTPSTHSDGARDQATLKVRTDGNDKLGQPSIEVDAGSQTGLPPYDATALSRSATLPQMPDTRTEFDAMTAIAKDFLESNPRRIKRLLNTYRYVKILAARLPGSQVHTAGWQQTMLYWLAFTMRWPAFISEAIEAAKQDEDLADEFLVGRLRSGNNRHQPSEEDILEHLRLTAKEALEHFELAPNFLIENPGTNRNSDAEDRSSNRIGAGTSQEPIAAPTTGPTTEKSPSKNETTPAE